MRKRVAKAMKHINQPAKTVHIIIAVLICIAMISVLAATFVTEEDVMPVIHDPVVEIIKDARADVFFLDRKLDISSPIYYVSGRIYLPVSDLVQALGGSVTNEDKPAIIMHEENIFIDPDNLAHSRKSFADNDYLSLYDLSQLLNLAVCFEGDEGKIMLYNREQTLPPAAVDYTASKKAYIRFEDIYFDGGLQQDNSNAKCEKLRVIADYMYNIGQHYYIAWIPLYTNPPASARNDLTSNFNLYNADAIFTIDYMTHHNGHIVLHGLTHQYGNQISAEGNEFGNASPYSDEEAEKRMLHAKEIASFLGYEDDIWEFPHYEATLEEYQIAERHFNILYQQYPKSQQLGTIVTVKQEDGRTVKYFPIPLTYVESNEKLPEMFARIDSLPENQEQSMFFHPILEYDKITCTTSQEGEREFHYDETGILPQIVKKFSEKNMYFSQIDR